MNKRDAVLRILRKIEVTELAGEKVMVDFENGKYLMLKGAGNDIWGMIREGCRVSEIVANLMEIYEVEESQCVKSTFDFLEKMVGFGFIALDYTAEE